MRAKNWKGIARTEYFELIDGKNKFRVEWDLGATVDLAKEHIPVRHGQAYGGGDRFYIWVDKPNKNTDKWNKLQSDLRELDMTLANELKDISRRINALESRFRPLA